MQAHAHHPPAFLAQLLQRVAQVALEAVGVAEAGGHGELHVVVVQRIGDDQLRLAVHLHVVRQVVVIGVALVEEAAMLGHQAPRVGADASGVPAHGPLAAEALDRLDAARDLGAFHRLGHRVVVDPAPGVGGDLMPRLGEGAGGGGVQLQRAADAIDRQPQIPLGEEAQHAPDAGPRAVVELAFHRAVALAQDGRAAGDLVQVELAAGIAVQHRVLAAFLVVQHEGEGDARAVRPARVGRGGAMAGEVAREEGDGVGDLAHGARVSGPPRAGQAVTARARLGTRRAASG